MRFNLNTAASANRRKPIANSQSTIGKGAKPMNQPDCCDRRPRLRTKTGWKRRVRVLFRLAVRKLGRLELVETDSRGNPKINWIRWMM
jgi:hypothetical protein